MGGLGVKVQHFPLTLLVVLTTLTLPCERDLYFANQEARGVFSFFSTPNLRAPSADRRQTLPHDRNLVLFYNASPKIRGGALPPKKNLGAKNMQNFGRFYTISHFDREYLRNASRYPKSEN